MLGKIINEGAPIPWRGNRNGESVRFTIPAGGIIEVLDVNLSEAHGYEKKIYIGQITVDGVKYTNVEINKTLIDEGWFKWIPANQAGGKKRRSRYLSKRRRNRRRRTAK
jgi:hypothetical protein